jgi:hypothetical protein
MSPTGKVAQWVMFAAAAVTLLGFVQVLRAKSTQTKA